jgi:hypothetical protein
MIIPRLAVWLDAEDCLFLSAGKIVRTFVISDCITFWMQGGGGGLTAAKDGIMPTIGKWVGQSSNRMLIEGHTWWSGPTSPDLYHIHCDGPSFWSATVSFSSRFLAVHADCPAEIAHQPSGQTL